MAILARYDLKKFNWEPLQGVPKGFVRRLGGCERTYDTQNRHFKGLHMLFFGLMVDLHDPVSITKLTLSAQECWCSLRLQFPILASSISGSDEGPTLTYTTGNPEEISRWAQRTLLIHSPSCIDLEQLRVDESQKKVPSPDGDFIWMHLTPDELADDRTVSKFGMLFHAHHSLFDGSGVKIMVNFYLDQLAKVLSDSCSTTESIQWGDECQNLPPAVFSILNSHEALPIPPDSAQEPSLENEYYKCLGIALADKAVAMTKASYGFRTRPKDEEWPKTRRAEVFFTREESARILVAAKTSGFTLTHVAHAALGMTIIADNPPNSAFFSHYLNSSAAVNCRGRLDSNWSLYPGYALNFVSIRIPVSAFLSPDGCILPLDRDVLRKVAEIAKGQYRTHLGLQSGLSHSAQLGETLMARSGNVKVPAEQCYSFISDGIGERYLNPTFTADTGKTVLSVTKFFLSTNTYDADPVFRVSSWGGIINIHADYNTNVIKAEDMMSYLNQWKRFIFLILE